MISHPGVRTAEDPAIPDGELEWVAIRSQGPGGQNVNKVSSAVQLRFDIARSSLPDDHKARLLALPDRRITRDGVLVIRAQVHRSQDMNRAEARARLDELIGSTARAPKRRRATRPTRGSIEARLRVKALRADVKSLRRNRDD